MKLPLFRKSRMDKLESVIASLTKRDDQLAAKRITGQKALDKAIKARQEALLSGDLDDHRALDKLQNAVDSATSALSGIDDALALLAQQKAEADSQLVEERDRAERAKVSEEINAPVSDIEKRVEPTLSAMREIAEKLMALDHLSFEIGQLGRHLSGVAGEAEIAFAFVVPDVRRMADAVKDGSAAIPRRPKAPPIPVPEPEPKGVPYLGVHMADPALREANFTVIDRGPARKLEIAP